MADQTDEDRMFESDIYTVKQKFLTLGAKYRVYEDGELFLKSKQKTLNLDGSFNLYDEEDNTVLKATTEQVLDVAASYTIIDERNDETVGAIKRNWTPLKHEWELIDSENRVIGIVEEDSKVLAFMRRISAKLFPFRYSITSQKDEHLGDLDGKFTLKNVYTLDLSDDEDKEIDRRLGVAVAVLIDAIERS